MAVAAQDVKSDRCQSSLKRDIYTTPLRPRDIVVEEEAEVCKSQKTR